MNISRTLYRHTWKFCARTGHRIKPLCWALARIEGSS